MSVVLTFTGAHLEPTTDVYRVTYLKHMFMHERLDGLKLEAQLPVYPVYGDHQEFHTLAQLVTAQ